MIEESRATNSIILRRRNNARVTRVLTYSGSSHDKGKEKKVDIRACDHAPPLSTFTTGQTDETILS